jgi:hypothetical protein
MPELSDEELDIPEGLDPNIRAELRRGRERERDAEAANKRAADLERELAFSKAGIPDNPLNATLAKSYTGENDPASVKAYFEGLGVDLSGTAQGGGPSDEELAAQRQVAQVGAAGEAGGDIRFEDAINSAKTPEDLMALIASAPEGATTNVGGRNRRIGPPTIE